MKKITNKKPRYLIRLGETESSLKSYRVSKEIFISIKKFIEPYRSYGYISKKVRCVETGEIFKNSKAANLWLIKENKTNKYDAHNSIRNVCKDKQKTAYGFHWEFIE